MRVTSIGLWVEDVEVAEFSYEDPMSLNPYMARAVIGLDADELTPGFYGEGSSSGRKFYQVERPKPVVVIRIVLNPNASLKMSFSQLRDNLYRTIAANRTASVTLKFNSGATLVAQIDGGASKFEVNHNSEVPELQMTIKCRDNFLRSPNPVYLDADDIPAVNPIEITDGASTAPHGFEMEFEFTSAESQFRIHDEDNDWGFEIVYDFEVGDVLYISSQITDLRAQVTRSAVTTQIADKIRPDSVWPVLFHGQNFFVIDEIDSVDIVYVQYRAAYWGV